MSFLALIFMLILQPPAQQAQQSGPIVGSVSCKGCHENEYVRWSDSIHGRMIQRANHTSVVSDIDLAGGPATSKLWRDGALFITENGVENKIDYTLGNRRIQHYLTTRPNGEIHVLHTSWDVKRHEWFDSKDIVQGAPSGFIQQWNTSCVYCHVTQQVQDVKGFDPKTLEYKTSWVESSATCERCHGPMAEHANDGTAAALIPTNSFDRLVTCAQCHWPKTVVATGFTMQKAYFDYYSPALMNLEETTVDPNWWVDGRPRRFSNEAQAFFLSGCFQSGQASCMNCHDPHWNRTDGNDQLMKNADQYCIKCHEGLKVQNHTHHAESSAGSSCVGCHMPHAVQGVKATMRDHSMSFPEPENTVRYNVPNSCNECHSDKTAEWALENVEAWYPNRSPRPRLRATTFTLAKKNDPRAVNALVRLANDKTENPAIRATAVGFLGHFPGETSTAILLAMTRDKEPMVRIEAARGLGGVPSESSAVALAGLLDDPYLSVRVRAASSLTSPLFPTMTFSGSKQQSFDKAVDEFRKSLELEGDHPNVQVRLGNLESTLGNRIQARDAFQRALKLDPAEADAYVGLAIMDLESGDKAGAVKNAKHAVDVSSGKEAYRRFLEKIEAGQQR